MIDDDDEDDLLLPDDDDGSDTDIRVQGDRDTHWSDDDHGKAALPFEVGQLCGEFHLEKLLGRGSSGCVFRALDTVSRRSCALKILIRPNQSDIRRDRIGFRRMMGMRHANLLRVDQLHRLGDYVALSMEEIHGMTLAKSRRRLRRLDQHIALSKLLSLTRDYAAGLAAMHSNGLLHRDIKPSNLMVDRNDVGKIIDYGLVGTFDAELDSQCYRDYIAGTLRYIAPEAYFDQHYTPAGEIFSLGLVILEFLHAITGRNKWARDKDDKSQDALLISSAVDELSGSIPEVLRDGVLEMLQVDARDRPTAMQVARLGMPIGKSTIYMGGQPLFGRETEFQQICDWIGEVYEGSSGRIHIHGDSGIGKTGLIDAVERHLKSLRWGQVFRARCRPRDSQPMQAFDQFADQIASRYISNDRHALHVDPVSAEILHQAFPVLKDVVKKSMRMQTAASGQDRADALSAAVKLSVQLRRVGPLILIVDDVQWADIDSCSVLDELQVAGGAMLGIITISRNKETIQQQEPCRVMKLNPLPNHVAIKMLLESAKRWSVTVNDAEIAELAEVAAGNPFRLSELADEFRPGGLLHLSASDADSALARLGNLDRLCQHRVMRLSDEARWLLPLIATADCAVSIDQLEKLTNLGDVIEIAVSELVNHRLVMDDATGGDCVSMIHDRVCDGVIAKLGPSECRTANLAWADFLRSENENAGNSTPKSSDPSAPVDGAGNEGSAGNDAGAVELRIESKQAGRIAGHLIDANRPSEAVPYAKLAAIESERSFAFSEAGTWHAKVASIDSESKAHHLREAARLFVAGDQPTLAANCHLELVDLSEGDEIKRSHEVEATKLLIGSGRFDQSRKLLDQLVVKLNLPKVDAKIQWLAVATRGLKMIRHNHFRRQSIRTGSSDSAMLASDVAERMDLASSLVRPMIFFNVPFATELFLEVAKHVQQHGSVSQQVGSMIASAAFACCDGGARRNRGQELLREIQSVAIDDGYRAAGDYWAAKTLVNVLSMDWQAVDATVLSAVKAYQSHPLSCRRQESEVQWLGIAAKWYTGEWEGFVSLCDTLVEDSKRRDDRLTHFLASSGFASASWLMQDDVDSLCDVSRVNDENFSHAGHVAELFQFATAIQMDLYKGDYQKAHETWLSFDLQLSKSHLSRLQLARVLASQFGALAAIHLLKENGDAKWEGIAKRCLGKLRSERLPCTDAISSLYAGIVCSLTQNPTQSRQHLVSARQLAREQGLAPIDLAASDQIKHLETGEWHGVLHHRMHSCSIANPEHFERIYTVKMTG
ncbi:serine/threonine-protein kinase PknK [Planctomycetes bacterium K23_9]|uniref:Serine/threonine-protein kinase PknA n=1 Tax=Stieleria marina TaxID=1930275 RepID=A0A517NY24_9BACT|nr:Serine/threonine-protein kinase PknA [Planctomycetes bacterium K23_9]